VVEQARYIVVSGKKRVTSKVRSVGNVYVFCLILAARAVGIVIVILSFVRNLFRAVRIHDTSAAKSPAKSASDILL
jgi:hypothetical protein